MTNGEGLLALLYTAKDVIESGLMWVLTSVAVICFFLLIISYVGEKSGLHLPFVPEHVDRGTILFALFILFVIFSLYSLIGLAAAVFGVNASPTGGLIIR